MDDAVIVAARRSPIGRAVKGSLRDMRGDELGRQVVAALLDDLPQLDPREIDDVIAGGVQPDVEPGTNVARHIALLLGHDHLPGVTVNRYCASSLQTTRMAAHAIRAGEGDAFLSVGVEAVSQYAFRFAETPTRHEAFVEPARRTARINEGELPWRDPREEGLMPDAYIAMGHTAENVAQHWGVSRQDQDEFAVRSQNLAEAAADRGFWAEEITPVQTPDGVVDADDSPRRGVTLESVAALPPAFRPDGSVTAGNACPVNDGAAAVMVMSARRAAELEITPLARIVSTAATGLSPEVMGMGPVEASRLALRRAGLTIDDIDLVEINEAFAAQVIASARELRIDLDRLNVNGGGIALGHPFGMTGARITTTLLHNLVERDAQYGLETMCVGGGQGMAMVVERLS